jgi:hypothetical protein
MFPGSYVIAILPHYIHNNFSSVNIKIMHLKCFSNVPKIVCYFVFVFPSVLDKLDFVVLSTKQS